MFVSNHWKSACGIFLAAAMIALSPAPAAANNFWWPKGGEEVGYGLYMKGEKVGRTRIKFAKDGDAIVAVQDQRVQVELGGGIDILARVVFREWWNGDEMTKMTTFGKVKIPTGDRRFKVSAERNGAGDVLVTSERHADRNGGPDRLPMTFWHLQHITSPDVFEPFGGGFASLDFTPKGQQPVEIEDKTVDCLLFDLHMKYLDKEDLGELPPGVDPADVPLERTFQAWFEPDGLLCAMKLDSPMGSMLMMREYRKTN